MDIKDLYQTITSLKHDTSLEINSSNYVILQPHQIIPKYYIFSDDSRHALILNYSTGSGKTISGLFCILNQLRVAKMFKIYNNLRISKAIVIGEWMTHLQFSYDMSRSIFGLISEKYNTLFRNAETKEEKEEILSKVADSMKNLVNFQGYQSFFNLLFPYYYSQRIQDIDVLINDYKQNKLQVNEEMIETLRDNVIVVDEMQKLYNQNGLNTYGFALSYLIRRSKELNLKIIYMSGTIFNTSVSELSAIINLVSDSTTNFFKITDFCEQETVNGMISYKISPQHENNAIKHLSEKYISYSRNTIKTKQSVLTIPQLQKLQSKPYICPSNYLTKSVVIENDNSNYPTEIKLGNVIIDDSFALVSIPAKGEQLKAIETATFSLDEDEEKQNSYLSPLDAIIPKGIRKDQDGIFYGDFLDKKNIGNYCGIAEFIIDLCLNNSLNKEKTILYHNRLNNFGLLQYGKILEYNGFVRRGFDVENNSICKLCKTTYEKHSKSCPRFTPIYYEFLHGMQKPAERKYIVNQLYNHPNNLYGDIISILLISDVAYAGVSFMNTNNLAILSRVSNMSKIEQISARIVRFKSHLSLPINKRFAKIYIVGIGEDKHFVENYYSLRILNQKRINSFLKILEPKSIGNLLLKRAKDYKYTEKELKILKELVFDDGKEILENITDVLIKSVYLNYWGLDRLIERITSKSLAISYLDLSIFPKEFVKYFILNNSQLETFVFKDLEDNNHVYVRNKVYNKLNETHQNRRMIEFKDISADYDDAIKDYKHVIETTNSNVKKRIYYIRLMELLSILNDFKPLAGWKYFWSNYVFNINAEYYSDDDSKFLINHCEKNRSVKKIAGTYWQDRIVLKTGETKKIEKKFVDTIGLKEIHTVFHIEAGIGLKVLVYDTNYEKGIDDRYVQRGKDCITNLVPEITRRYKLSDKNTVERCYKLIPKICEDQIKNSKEKFVTTPFEKDLRF